MPTLQREQWGQRNNEPALVAAGTPTIFVQSGLMANSGDVVEVPIAFDSFGAHVAALSFSLDYDEQCLVFQPDDLDANGVPDAFVAHSPAQFFLSVTWHPNDHNGELDVILADYIPPLAVLPDTADLFVIQFRTICPVALGMSQAAFVRFAATPAIGFSDPNGRDLTGIARDGEVQVIGAGDATMTPVQTPAPPSPTPTLMLTAPSTPTPAPSVFLELVAWPERVTRADQGIILSLDYVILTAANEITLNVVLPDYVQFNSITSTFGWQCEASAVSPHCQFPLYRQSGQNSTSGRLFFGVLLSRLLPAQVTQLDFTTMLLINNEPGSQTQQLVVPVLPTDVPPPPGGLQLDLSTAQLELSIGRDHVLAYSFIYTNTNPIMLRGLEFHLLLPSVGAVLPAAEESLDWICSPAGSEQQGCILAVAELEAGVTRQAPFVLTLVQSTRLKEMHALVAVVYAVSEDRMLAIDVAIVPIQQGHSGSTFIFLPLVANQSP